MKEIDIVGILKMQARIDLDKILEAIAHESFVAGRKSGLDEFAPLIGNKRKKRKSKS